MKNTHWSETITLSDKAIWKIRLLRATKRNKRISYTWLFCIKFSLLKSINYNWCLLSWPYDWPSIHFPHIYNILVVLKLVLKSKCVFVFVCVCVWVKNLLFNRRDRVKVSQKFTSWKWVIKQVGRSAETEWLWSCYWDCTSY